MKIHDPKNLSPLKIDRAERQELLRSEVIESLTGSKMLLDEELNILLFEKLLKNHERIKELKKQWQELHKDLNESETTLDKMGALNNSKKLLEERNKIAHGFGFEEVTLEDFDNPKSLEEDMMDDLQKLSEEYKSRIQQITGEIEEELVEFEEEHRVGLNILEDVNICLCSSCNSFLYEGRFKKHNCVCGAKIESTSDITKINTKMLPEAIEEFLEQNLWFEHASAYLLRRLNFDTRCGGYVLGNSGQPHEIDILAEKASKRKRVLCECKTSRPTVSEILVFAGKINDIGCTKGILFTLVPYNDIDEELIALAASNNIEIIAGVLESDTEELENKIESLSA